MKACLLALGLGCAGLFGHAPAAPAAEASPSQRTVVAVKNTAPHWVRIFINPGARTIHVQPGNTVEVTIYHDGGIDFWGRPYNRDTGMEYGQEVQNYFPIQRGENRIEIRYYVKR